MFCFSFTIWFGLEKEASFWFTIGSKMDYPLPLPLAMTTVQLPVAIYSTKAGLTNRTHVIYLLPSCNHTNAMIFISLLFHRLSSNSFKTQPKFVASVGPRKEQDSMQKLLQDITYTGVANVGTSTQTHAPIRPKLSSFL